MNERQRVRRVTSTPPGTEWKLLALSERQRVSRLTGPAAAGARWKSLALSERQRARRRGGDAGAERNEVPA